MTDIGQHSHSSPSEQELTQLFDRLPFAVSLINPDGRCDHATQRAIEIFGRIALQMDGSPHSEVDWQLVDGDGEPLDPSQLPSGITRMTGEEFENVPVGFPGKDGTRVWLQMSTRRLTDGDGPPYAVVESFTDVTAERAALTEVDLVGQMLTRAFDHAPIGIAIVATDGRWMRVNQALCDLLGYSEEELLVASFQDITHPDDLEADMALVEDVLAGRRSSYQMNKRYIRADGREIWAQLSVAVVQDKDGKPLHFISQIQDVTERHKLDERLRELADRDHLTGLLNRRRFEEELNRQLERCARHGEGAALLLLDIDHFKQVNDNGGHAEGDALLQSVADAFARRVRSTDLVARVGGDEFAAILVDSDEAGATQVAEALLQSIREIASSAVTASIGLTIMSPDDMPDAVLARADRALYAVKDSGRDGVQLDNSLQPHPA